MAIYILHCVDGVLKKGLANNSEIALKYPPILFLTIDIGYVMILKYQGAINMQRFMNS